MEPIRVIQLDPQMFEPHALGQISRNSKLTALYNLQQSYLYWSWDALDSPAATRALRIARRRELNLPRFASNKRYVLARDMHLKNIETSYRNLFHHTKPTERECEHLGLPAVV